MSNYEKIILKPTVKELLHRNGEDGVHFDVLSYQGAGNRERILGSLFVIGQIKYSEEDLSYAISLISSLAKREYYSEQSLQNQNAKKAFEYTLGKLNEILEDFFKNKNLKLNVGLAAISGNDIYISRLGKLKVALARNDKYVDILNNVDLFSKDSEGAKQFSNIISGKLHPQDKILAYFPTRSFTAREKQLNELFVKENQEVFGQKITHLAANVNNFSCCGIHIDMQEVKEIPIEDSFKNATEVSTDNQNDTTVKIASETARPASPTGGSEPSPQESPRIIPAEFNITRRGTFLTFAVGQFYKLKKMGKLNFWARSRGFLLIAGVVMLPLAVIIIVRSTGPSSVVKSAINKAGENFKLAQSRLNQSNVKEARILLQATLFDTAGISNKKMDGIRQEINQTLGGINHTSDKQPQLYFDPASNNNSFKAGLIAIFDNLISAASDTGSVFSLSPDGVSELAQFKTTPRFLFNSKSYISVFNGSDGFGAYDLKTKKTVLYSLNEPVPATDTVIYENNLYVLAANNIYKYTDATTGGIKRTTWASDDSNGTLVAITVDGNVYALNSEGKLIKYLKGKKISELDLQLTPTSGSRIFTFKDSAFIYLTDKTAGLVYVFDKSSGELKITYDLSSVGSINDISIAPDGTVWILSTDNKVWLLR